MKRIIMSVFCFAFAMAFVGWVNQAAGEQEKVLANTFKGQNLEYNVSYPNDWVYTFQAPYIVVFSAKKVASGEATISIRNLNSTLVAGGRFKDVDSVIDGLLNQLKTTKDAVVYDPELYIYSEGQTKLTGKQVVVEYILQGEKYKQWVVVLPRVAGDVFHVWSFVSKAKSYDANLVIAKAMLNSFTIIQ
ncbi:MAG: hypothetical protein LBQ00_03550 [Syntrophobacterales bacterium]|jgi:hypothetical protein|nr:hypothetical protein [Syntrophobacterales bacterium]